MIAAAGRAAPTRHYVSAAHGQVHLRIAEPPAPATAPPLICLHPSPVSSLAFATFMPAMATDRRVIALDTPGYGGSDPLPGTPSIEHFAATLWPVVAAMAGDGPVDLFGYHTGSAIALELARARPASVRRIVLNSALMFSDVERVEFRDHFAAREARTVPDKAAELGASYINWRSLWRDVPEDKVWALFIETQRRGHGMATGFFAAFRHDFPAALAAVDHPVMILNPSDDLYEMTLRLEPTLPANAHIHPLPGWTHGFLDAWPEEIAALLRGFLPPK